MTTKLTGAEKVALVLVLVFAAYVFALTTWQASAIDPAGYPWTPEQEAAAYGRIESGEVEGW